MRNFTDFEKSFILEIIYTPIEKKNAKGEEVFMRCGDTLLRNFFNCAEIKISPDKKSFEIYIDNKTTTLTPTNLFDTLYLIKYLEDNAYLGIDQIPNEVEELDFVDPKYKKEGEVFTYVASRPISWMKPEMPRISILTPFPKYTFNFQLAADLQRFCSSTYHPTSALIDLAKDFKTPEMRISEEQIKIGWWAIGIAFFTSLISIIISICK